MGANAVADRLLRSLEQIFLCGAHVHYLASSGKKGFEHPGKGSITLNGDAIDRLPAERTVPLGLTIVPKGARVFADMSVLDNLKMGSYIKSERSVREQSLEQVFTLFPRLQERAHQKGGTLRTPNVGHRPSVDVQAHIAPP